MVGARMNHPERISHLAILQYLRAALLGNPIIHHSPNELGLSGQDAARQVAKHKHLGMVPGFPDLVAFTFHGPLFFEIKAAASKPTAPQESVHADLRRLNYRVAVVRSIDDVRAALAAWGIPTRDSEPKGELMP
jgi:hypothetical protein